MADASTPRQAATKDRGAAAVEFAIVALLMLTLVLMVFEGGRLWMMQASLASAAREGAREMAITNDQGQARTRVNNAFTPVSGGATPSVAFSGTCPPSPPPGAQVTVTATFPATMMTGLLPPPPQPLRGIGVMRCNG